MAAYHCCKNSKVSCLDIVTSIVDAATCRLIYIHTYKLICIQRITTCCCYCNRGWPQINNHYHRCCCCYIVVNHSVLLTLIKGHFFIVILYYVFICYFFFIFSFFLFYMCELILFLAFNRKRPSTYCSFLAKKNMLLYYLVSRV